MAKLKTGMRKRPGGGYEYRFSVEGKRYSVGGTTIAECLKKADEKSARIKAGFNNSVTLNQYFEEWIRQKERSVKASTVLVYTCVFKNHISQALGSHKVVSLQRRQVMDMLEHIADTTGIPTANIVRRVMGSILKGAMRDEIIPRNVVASIQSFKNPKPPARETIHRELNEEELRAFFSLAKNSIYYNAFRFMLYTGVRVGECAALQWQDVDFKNRLIHIRKTATRDKRGKWLLGDSTKTKRSKRDIPMNEAIRVVISEQMELQRGMHGVFDLCGFVFPSAYGQMAQPNAISRRIPEALKKGRSMRPKIEIKPFSVHAFRDTFASRAVRAGIPPNTLKEILGHSSLAMTMDLYAHVSQQDKIKGMKKMRAINFG